MPALSSPRCPGCQPSESGSKGMAEVLEFLASLPAPEDILALRPSASLQARISDLLDRNRRMPERFTFARHEIDHVVAMKRGTTAS